MESSTLGVGLSGSSVSAPHRPMQRRFGRVSARGLASEPKTWPDMVANGIDVISTWPTNIPKPENRRRDDEANPVFQKSVPKDQWPHFSIESGTSQATAQVSRASAQIIAYVRNAAQQKGQVQAGDKLFSITVPRDRLAATGKRGPRLTGELHPIAGSTDTEIIYRLVQPWRLVKQLLMDTAVPMPGFFFGGRCRLRRSVVRR